MSCPQEPAPTDGDLLDRPAGRPSMVVPLNRLIRLVHAVKAHLTAGHTPVEARERAAHVLLFPLVETGGLRQGALAERTYADPSTVSRHVSLLVDRGLVRRELDPQDGRSSRLVATPAGRAVLAQMHRDREALLDRVTSAWSAEDLTRFTELLDRFVRDLTDHLPTATAGGPTASAEADR